MIALIVPVLKNFRGFTELMASTDLALRVFVLDNWRENRGVAPAWNEGLRQAVAERCDYAVIVNDDVILRSHTLERLCEPLDGQLVMTSATNEIESPYLSVKPDHRYALDFACFAVRPQDFVRKLGYFDENFRPAYFEDADMRYRMMLLGYDGLAIAEARMYHVWSTTQLMDGPVCSHEQFRNNQRYYVEKWGGDHRAERFSRPFGNPAYDVNYWARPDQQCATDAAGVVAAGGTK